MTVVKILLWVAGALAIGVGVYILETHTGLISFEWPVPLGDMLIGGGLFILVLTSFTRGYYWLLLFTVFATFASGNIAWGAYNLFWLDVNGPMFSAAFGMCGGSIAACYMYLQMRRFADGRQETATQFATP